MQEIKDNILKGAFKYFPPPRVKHKPNKSYHFKKGNLIFRINLI